MLKGIFQKKLGLRQQTIDRYCEPEEDQGEHKGQDRLKIIDRKVMNKIEKDRGMTGGTITTRTGIYKETTEKMIKIENQITTSKNNKEILQKDKDTQMISREKEGNDNVNNNSKT